MLEYWLTVIFDFKKNGIPHALNTGSRAGSRVSDEVDEKMPGTDIWNMHLSQRKNI